MITFLLCLRKKKYIMPPGPIRRMIYEYITAKFEILQLPGIKKIRDFSPCSCGEIELINHREEVSCYTCTADLYLLEKCHYCQNLGINFIKDGLLICRDCYYITGEFLYIQKFPNITPGDGYYTVGLWRYTCQRCLRVPNTAVICAVCARLHCERCPIVCHGEFYERSI